LNKVVPYMFLEMLFESFSGQKCPYAFERPWRNDEKAGSAATSMMLYGDNFVGL